MTAMQKVNMTGLNEEHFLQNLNQHSGIIHRICNSYFADEEMRKDLFQEIVYQMWKSYRSFKGLSKFSTWMYKIALNTAIMHSGKAQRLPEHQSLEEGFLQIAETDDTASTEQMAMLYAAINTLTEMDKAIILLHLDEQSYDEIADITGLTKTNVSVRLVRIKKKLETYFKNKKD